MKKNKTLLMTAILLFCCAYAVMAQRHADLSLSITTPATGTVINNGDSEMLEARLINNGPDTFLAADTMYIFGSALNMPASMALAVPAGVPVPPGDTATLEFGAPLGIILNNRTETTDTTIELCLNLLTGNLMTVPITTDVLDTIPGNNRACINVTFKGVAVTSIAGHKNKEQHSLKLYPNPAHGSVTFEIAVKTDEPVQAVIRDIAGREIATKNYGKVKAGQTSLQMDIAALEPGLYIVNLQTGTSVQSGKMVVR